MYLRTIRKDKTVMVQLLTVLSKSAPIKGHILELCGEKLLCILLLQSARDLDIPMDFGLIDSAVSAVGSPHGKKNIF